MEDDEEMVTGTCGWCGDDTRPVYRDTGLCEECECDTYHCTICDARMSETGCRHLFRDQDGVWRGAGAGEPVADDRTDLHAFLDAMPVGFAKGLQAAIASGKFHTFLISPLVGAGGILELHGMPGPDVCGFDWGDCVLDMGDTSEPPPEVENGFYWLQSLFDELTPDANAATILWIDEWLSKEADI